MPIPPPTEKQARVLWFSLTTLALAIALVLFGLLFWGVGMVLNRLSAVLLPLAAAGVIACLLQPAVDFFERHRIPRVRAILLVFFLAIGLVLILMATVVPQLFVEIAYLTERLPEHFDRLRINIGAWLAQSPWGVRARELWETRFAGNAQEWLATAAPVVSAWIGAQLLRMTGWFALFVGLALIPVYVFYFLLESKPIRQQWTRYVPLRESRVREEVVFVLKEISERMIVFFRGQVLVAMCVGVLLTIGFFAVGLNYALLLGVIAGVLSIVPYLGVMLSIVPAITLAAVQFGDWLHPLLVLVVFVAVQTFESLFISPKIIGDRVGLHPLTVIVAVMIGTALMGGIIGGLLAIPLTAALRTLMFRYVYGK